MLIFRNAEGNDVAIDSNSVIRVEFREPDLWIKDPHAAIIQSDGWVTRVVDMTVHEICGWLGGTVERVVSEKERVRICEAEIHELEELEQ